MFWGAGAIFLLVMALTGWALVARRSQRLWLSRRATIVAGGVIVPLIVLTLLLIRGLLPSASAEGPAALRIEVTGEQWWWRVAYLNDAGDQAFATANEIHIPTGRPIELLLRSADVIHSFWVPNLAGKLDMIPGRVNRMRLHADRDGELRGQCAEYCGGPHALMAFDVVAQSPDAFEQWRARQREEATAPTFETRQGYDWFLARGCGVCHAVRGTPAVGTRGPDLTHVGSRRSLGAGTLPNNAESLVTWIASSQHVKPQNLMPSYAMLPSSELQAIAAYLLRLR